MDIPKDIILSLLAEMEFKDIFHYCLQNKRIYNICKTNKIHILKNLLRKKGFTNLDFDIVSFIKEFYKIDPNLKLHYINLYKAYQNDNDNDNDHIVNVLLKNFKQDKLNLSENVYDISDEIDDILKGKGDSKLFIELIRFNKTGIQNINSAVLNEIRNGTLENFEVNLTHDNNLLTEFLNKIMHFYVLNIKLFKIMHLYARIF